MDADFHLAVIIPAAGRGRRFGQGPEAKLEADLGGRAVLLRTVELFSHFAQVHQVIVAVDPDTIDTFKFKWADRLGLLQVRIVPGGTQERWETVMRALEAVDEGITHVAVHDAVRPLASADMLNRLFEAACHYPAVIPTLTVSDTVKRVDPAPAAAEAPKKADPLDAILGDAGKVNFQAHPVIEHVPREGLHLVQTPQVFALDTLRSAYAQVESGAVDPAGLTDDAAIVQASGQAVVAVEGDPLNIKITAPPDLEFARAVFQLRSGSAGSGALGPKRKFPTWAESEDD
ncbi:MAG: 2-C-methyl-D-erythritol 4-phosphate cytidylyltransferase [Phycisphaerae bacterium]|nr:2-C-methyl-D-erythritol 4-phosphate cytidylyltransferase [Phycisphaerae bacterium]